MVQAHREGKAIPHSEDNRLYETCIFTSYMTEHMPALMREVNSRYAVDGLLHQCVAADRTAAGVLLRGVQGPAALRHAGLLGEVHGARRLFVEDVGWDCEGEGAGQSVLRQTWAARSRAART